MPFIDTQNREVKALTGIHLYHFWLSSCSQRVRMVLDEKGLAWTGHEIDLEKMEHATEEFQSINPKGLVPAMVVDGRVMIESIDIIDYLDTTYPEPPLRPANKDDEAKMLKWMADADDAQHSLKLLTHEFLFKMHKMPPDALAHLVASHRNDELTEFMKVWASEAGFPRDEIDEELKIQHDCFVALDGASSGDCVALARTLGRTVAERFGIPVFLYEDAAARPERRALEDIRRGQLDGLAARMAGDPDTWRPDFGPPAPHATAGVSVIGARPILIAFNVNLDTDDVRIAHRIARTVRASSGGLPHVKAIGVRLAERGAAQVSMNLTDYTQTPLHRVFEAVEREARRWGVRVAGSEVVGLVPAAALIESAVSHLRIDRFRPAQLLDAQAGLPRGEPHDG